MERFFVDTSAWFSIANDRDPRFRQVRELLRPLAGKIVTSNYVLDESITLTRFRRGFHDAARLGAFLMNDPHLSIVRVTAEDERLAWELFLARADQMYSFTDCTSFVLMRRLKIQHAIALDQDFAREGFIVLPGSPSARP